MMTTREPGVEAPRHASARGCLARGRWARLRLADRIMLASLALTLGLLSVFGAAGYLALGKSEMRRTEALLDSTAKSVGREIERELAFIENLVAGVAGQALVSNALADARHGDDLVHPFLRDTLRGHGEFAAIALVNHRGDKVSAFGSRFSDGVSLPALAKSVIEGAKPTTVFFNGDNGARMVRAYPVVYLPTGNIEGAIIAEVIAQKLMPATLPATPLPFAMKLVASSGLPLASLGSVSDADTLRVSLPLETRLNADLGPLKLITETPRAAALAPLKQLQVIYTAMVVVAVAISVYFSRRMAARIASPIVALSDAARRATEQGHAALERVPVFGQGELAELAQHFNNMSGALQEAHARLEQRVDMRTRELREARERIKNILDSVDEVVYAAHADMSQMQFASAAASEVLGASPEHMTQAPGAWLALIHPEDGPRALAAHQTAAADEVGEISYRILRPNGEIRWVRDRFKPRSPLDEHDERRITGTLTDITEAVEAEQARVRAEEVLRTLHRAIQSSSAGVIISDLAQLDNPVLMVNPAFERITGYSQEEVIGRNCRFLQGADTDAQEIERLRRAIAQRAECKVILKNYRKDGSAFWNELSIAPVEDARGEITQFVGIMNDITALVDYQAQIVRSGEQLDAISTLSPDGFISMDGQGRIAFANPAIERMTGFSSASLIGLTAAQFDAKLTQLADPAHPYPTHHTALDGTDTTREALIYLAQPRQIILKRISRRAAVGATSTIIYFHDVTREMEVDRMKSEFLSTAAHELRTPMASVMGFSELLLTREFPRDTQLEYLEIINRQARRLTSLLNDLLDLARIEARRRGALLIGRYRLDQIARDAVASLMMPNDARKVELSIAEDLPEVEADAAKIAQALTNLLSNAYKYSTGGGRIMLSSCERVVKGQRQVGLAVRDEGMGMTRAQLARAFERFFRADDTGAIPGTGLGLSLVKEIMETHEGEIELQSEFGKGTTATLWLPVAARE